MTGPGVDIPLTRLAGRNVLFVMAADAEYGDHLKRVITPLMTGVGPVEAALGMGSALERLDAGSRLPDLVVSLGSAGSRVLEQGAIYQVASVAWRDMDASALGFAKGITPFLDDPLHSALPTPLPGLPCASLSTGANIVSGAAYDAVDGDMADMETFAVMRACQRYGVPLIGWRGISDGASELHHYDDWTILLHVLDEKLADAVGRLERVLDEGAFLAG